MPLEDRFRRRIDYLRISVTDRCNLRCIYCMPHERRPFEFKEILSYEEIITIVQVAAELGIRRVRLTGGEPLMRRNILYLIRKIAEIHGIEDLSLTTNGVLLEEMAEQLRKAGLSRVNVSLDSLDPDKYSDITRGGDIQRVLRGIKKAQAVGLTPVKLNVVVVRGINDDEVLDFAKLTLRDDLHVRFIEFMPGRHNEWQRDRVVTIKEIKEKIETHFPLEPAIVETSGPAKHWRIKDAKGLIGFISPLSEHFCNECNRLRITSDGKLRPCLFSHDEIDLKEALKNGASRQDLKDIFLKALLIKPEGHYVLEEGQISRPMSEIGG
ncbi:MAG: GTP 3',8-cyclase MoaA [Nitrospirae bacterium]|nr:MAG: GTP 3',8-cyclase MoaA [Nitrospirota bacterium]